MAITDDQYNKLLSRVTKLETYCNDLRTAISKFVTDRQVNELSAVLQQDIDAIHQDVESLVLRVEAIEEEPIV